MTAGFSRKNFCPPKNGPKYGPKTGFYWICSMLKISIICFFLAQIPYLEKHLFRDNAYNEIIPRFAFIEIAWVFLHVHIYLKLIKKILGGHDQKRVWPVWSCDFKIDCISRMNRWIELNFCMLVVIQECQQLFQWFLGGWVWSEIGMAI